MAQISGYAVMYRVVSMDGGWGVYLGSELISGPTESNTAAWRLADHLNMEPISRSEDVSEWINSKGND